MEWFIDIAVGWVAGSILFGLVAQLAGANSSIVALACTIGTVFGIVAMRWRRRIDEKNAW